MTDKEQKLRSQIREAAVSPTRATVVDLKDWHDYSSIRLLTNLYGGEAKLYMAENHVVIFFPQELSDA